MSKIIGVTVGTPTSPTTIEKEIKPVKTVNGVVPDENGNVEVYGNNGKDGADGKSAYKHAQDGGYLGTEEEFNTKLATDYIDWFGLGISIPEGADLDTYKTNGKYYVNSESGAKTLLNRPDGMNTNFVMWVFTRTTSAIKSQLMITLSGKMYIRSSSSSAWRAWVEYTTSAEIEAIRAEVMEELIMKEQIMPEFVDDISECTDTNKLYVLPDGYIYDYLKTTRIEENNEYNPATVKFNTRLNSSNAEKGLGGSLLTDYIAVEYAENYPVTIKGIEKLVLNYSSYFLVNFYTSDKTPIGQLTADQLGFSTTASDGTLPITFNLFHRVTVEEEYRNAKYVRLKLGIATDGTNISATDCAGLVINFEPKNISTSGYQWTNTGHAFIPTDYEDRIINLEDESKEHDERITILENSSSEGGTITIPTFWESAVNTCISKIKALQVGKNCITFPFFSDNHTRNGYVGILISHIMKECHIPYCFYGGDTIASGYLTESEMIAQDKAFDTIMSYIPNGRFCRAVGNHDGFWKVSASEKHSYTREQVYELFLREESIAQNKHYGDDGTYYYVDDIASKVRFIILNTNPVNNHGAGSEVIDSTQLSWLQNTALSFTESGWSVVIISHCPISNHYHANVTNAEEVISVVNESNVDIIGWYSGHIHRDRMYTHSAVGSTDGVEGTDGEELGFTEVTITSDHTGIAYDDATKHTVANDDKSHAIDFVTINKATRTVNLTRLGIGEDRSYTY